MHYRNRLHKQTSWLLFLKYLDGFGQDRLADKFEILCQETQHLKSLYRHKLDEPEALKKSLL